MSTADDHKKLVHYFSV